jgi:transporter family-2 protein
MPDLPLALLAGALLPAQAAANALLAKRLGGPVWASVVSFAVGLLTLLLAAALITRRLPTLSSAAAGTPWWAWTGGAIGAAFVLTAAFTIPRIGAMNLICWSVAGQLLASVLIDRFGLLGLDAQPVPARRLLGLALVGVGMVLVVYRRAPAA